MNEVNLQALANQATALQSHRGGTGEVRYVTVDLVDAGGQPAATARARRHAGRARRVSRRASAVERPVFQVAIVDVDTGLVITTATLDRAPTCRTTSRARARSNAASRSCRCGRASTCCGCRSPTRISSRRTTS